ncbi:hypothetical protein NP233_g9268 [Leucocoprinus birnbaumii]|uniref:Uncharacterized protein n=1 Tax=Leucocoprinus birnbaumii TaxID=56174 RepID=A0AAD5VKW1_9AGAR|nr:hypothetical protein NP233_g9268 [Leucocoprinus birnbaumii]
MKRRIVQYITFLILELGFIIFTWYCFRRHVPLRGDSTLLQSCFVLIFTTWHTIGLKGAWLAFKDILSRRKDQDDIFTITGLDNPATLFEVNHIFFLALALEFAGLFGVSAIVPTPSNRLRVLSPPTGHTNITVFNSSLNATGVNGESGGQLRFRLAQSSRLLELERIFGMGSWGYSPQPNWLIPLPVQDLGSLSQLAYRTDLVSFHHECSWSSPDGILSDYWALEDSMWGWDFGAQEIVMNSNGSGIIPLLASLAPSRKGAATYLFLGGNTSFPINPTDPDDMWIDLSGLPSAFSTDTLLNGLNLSLAPVLGRAPLATILMCDPHLEFRSGTVAFLPAIGSGQPNVQILGETDEELIGNVDPSWAKVLFSGVLGATSAYSYPKYFTLTAGSLEANISPVLQNMFLQNSSSPFPQRELPLDLKSISSQIDSYMLSALKAFVLPNKFVLDSHPSMSVSTFNFTTSVSVELTGIVPFAILHLISFIVAAVVLAIPVFSPENDAPQVSLPSEN